MQGEKQNRRELFILLPGRAGGSIGSELCRQIARFKPGCLMMYERDESHLFYIAHEIRKQYPDVTIISIIGDILNREKVAHLLATYNPDSIYHAAAYKHVPLMENQPSEALRNNLLGTKIISELAIQCEIPKLLPHRATRRHKVLNPWGFLLLRLTLSETRAGEGRNGPKTQS